MGALPLALLLLWSAPVRADEPGPFRVPWTDTAPELDSAAQVVRLAAVGRPDLRSASFAARRYRGREEAGARAKEALHRYVDTVLTLLRAGPRETVLAHEVVERHARIVALRPLVDGDAVVLMELPTGPLAEAVPSPRAPWNR